MGTAVSCPEARVAGREADHSLPLQRRLRLYFHCVLLN